MACRIKAVPAAELHHAARVPRSIGAFGPTTLSSAHLDAARPVLKQTSVPQLLFSFESFGAKGDGGVFGHIGR